MIGSNAPAKKPFWHRGRIIRYALVIAFLGLVFSFSPLVLPTHNLSPSEAAQARSGAAQILRPLMSGSEEVSIKLESEHLQAISNTISYTVPAIQLRLNSSNYGILIASSITTVPGLLYINLSCWLTPGINGTMEFTQCKFGHIPVPGKIVEYVVKGLTRLLFGEEALTTLRNILSNTQLYNEQIVVNFTKPENLKASVEERLTDTFKLVQEFRQLNGADTQAINDYVEYVVAQSERSKSSSELIGKTFLFAQSRSVAGDPVEENYAALWALAMTFGAPDFARIVAMPVDRTIALPGRFSLRSRMDLRLHFFYSVALRLASEKQMSINIGKLKEVMDSAQGGSGYSFRDLTADKSGVELADFAISNEENARRVQQVLAGSNDEGLFIPLLHDLPEGLREEEFSRLFGGEDDQRYLQMENEIDRRIASLPLYTDSPLSPLPKKPVAIADKPSNKTAILSGRKWYQIDTHTHSQYSDGRFSIADIASHAQKFGCDALAITDHGDHNLKGVFSSAYWEDFAEASKAQEALTLIAGLEWNIPPFAGREHMTLLLPETTNHEQLIAEFRNRFDHYGRTTEDTLSEQTAFSWLQEQFSGQAISPVIMYNHPSRKDQTAGENIHDMQKWRSQTPFVVGFSGAPGHQKKRGDSNGSYDYTFKTIHGWDPAIAQVGSDWDELLKAGIQSFAARAPSDFHNTNMDYWPCEFSTTHILAESRRPNDLLQALIAGSYWAQHGKFVATLDAAVYDDNNRRIAEAGNIINSPKVRLRAELKITLNNEDWQGFDTSLDEVTAVIISDVGIDTQVFYPDSSKKTFLFNIDLPARSGHIAVRWFGRSIQPEQHHYQFFTNPVMIYWQTQ